MQQSVSVCLHKQWIHYICPVCERTDQFYRIHSTGHISQTFRGSLFLIRMSWAPMKIEIETDFFSVEILFSIVVVLCICQKDLSKLLSFPILYMKKDKKKIGQFHSSIILTKLKESSRCITIQATDLIEYKVDAEQKCEIKTPKKVSSHRTTSIEWSKCWICLVSVSKFFFSSLVKCRVFVKWFSLDCMLCSNIE